MNFANHRIVISYDAFSEDNWETARRLPNLSKLIEQGAPTNQLMARILGIPFGPCDGRALDEIFSSYSV